MMRLKELLGCLLPLALGAAATAAPVTQLTDLRALSQASGTTVSIRTNGAFSHTEYRPIDGLLLVDLPGVLPGQFANKSVHVSLAGVRAYHVQSFHGASSADITRIEISLAEHSVVKVDQKANMLLVHVTGAPNESPAKQASPAPTAPDAAVAKALPDADPAPLSAAARPAIIKAVSIQRKSGGIDVDLKSDRQLTPHLLKLSNPDRIVIDFAGAVPGTLNRNLSVNSNLVKSVRIARNQVSPPLTRVVVDLSAPSDYRVSNEGPDFALHVVPLQANATAAPASPATAVMAAAIAGTPQPLIVPDTGVQQNAQPKAAEPHANETQVSEPKLMAALPVSSVAPELNNRTSPAEKPVVLMNASASRADLAAQRLVPAGDAVPGSQTTPALAAPTPVMPASAALQAQPAAVLQALQTAPPAPVPPAADQVPAATTTACNSTRFTGEPISVNLKEVDLRDFFRLIHEISGLNVVLDPDVRGTLTIVLDDVPWDQALNIVLHNNRLDCELEGNVLRIASTATIRQEADARRAQVDAQALAVDKLTVTRYLSYATAAEVLPIVKTFLSQRGDIIADARTNALIISDIPSVIPNVDNLIKQLDRKTPGVEIEARVVATTRSFARDIGTQFGFAFGNGNSSVSGAPIGNNTSPIQTPNLTPFYIQTAGQQAIPLFSNQPASNVTSGLGFINATRSYQIDFILSMAESRGLLKILSRPRIVTQNNIAGLIRQGVQVPVVTAAQLGGPPTTTYVNAFLRLQVKPQITAEGTVFLNIDVENTTPDFAQQVNGNPTLTTQQATTQVLVTDGGTVVIGGVIQTNSSVNTNEVPLLGDIPVLGNLFKRRAVQTTTQELIFFITPKIITT